MLVYVALYEPGFVEGVDDDLDADHDGPCVCGVFASVSEAVAAIAKEAGRPAKEAPWNVKKSKVVLVCDTTEAENYLGHVAKIECQFLS